MTQLCASPPPSVNKANGDQMFKGNMKRSPRCMQIDLLPLIASNISMTRADRSPLRLVDRSNADISPAVWDEKLRLWTRNNKLLPSTFNSEIDTCLEEQIQPESNAKEPCLVGHNANYKHSRTEMQFFPNDNDSSNEIQFFANDKDSSDEMQLFTSSTVDDQFPHENIENAAGRAWLSSLLDISNYQAKDVIAPSLDWTERENRAEEAPQSHLGVESLCSHLDTWDAVKLLGHELDTLSNYRSQTLNDWQVCTTTQMMTRDEGDERTRIHDDHFVDPLINKPLKLCPPFTSPWFNSKAHPCSETLSTPLDGSLDWTGGEAIYGGDMDAQGFDGLGLRPESESNRVRSRQYWNGDKQDSSGRNVRQRTAVDPSQNIIANEFLDNYDGFGPGDNLPKWFPQPGDILITKRSRQAVQRSPGGHATLYNPGGHVTLYKDPMFFHYTGEARQRRTTQYDFGDGDCVIRLGKFAEDWKWHPTPSIEAFLCDLRQVRPWWLVGRTFNNELQPPEYQVDEFRAPVNVVDRNFRPREGDLVVRAVPGEYNWGLYWWTHYFNFNPCDLVLRAGYEVRANGTCMVVELYYRELDDRDWSFRGRDVWTYLQARSPPASPR